MAVSIFSLVKPPYEKYLYVSYGELPNGMVRVYVWSDRMNSGNAVLDYPPADNARAKREAQELSTLIITTRRILDLPTPVKEPLAL